MLGLGANLCESTFGLGKQPVVHLLLLGVKLDSMHELMFRGQLNVNLGSV